MRADLAPQVVQVDRAVARRLDHDHLHAGHHGGGRVGAVRRGRDQADPPIVIAPGVVVGPDGQQPGQLALTAGVRLDRHPGITGHLGQPGLQGVDQGRVALGVLRRRERVQVGEPGVGDRLHLGGGVELHRAGSERDHPAIQREVPIRQRPQVAQHRRLAVVGVEHRVGQVGRAALAAGEIAVRVGARLRQAERLAYGGQVGLGRVLAHRDAHLVGVDQPQMYAAGPGRIDDLLRPTRYAGEHGVEEGTVHDLDARPAEGRRRAGWPGCAPPRRSPAARGGRGRPRTCWP